VKRTPRVISRRNALGVLAMFATFRPDVLKASSPGVLTVDLDQWKVIEVKHKGQVLSFTPEELFKGLAS
jgi:hypothetical protein